MATFVAPHAGRRIVLKMDLRDFFPSITAARVLLSSSPRATRKRWRGCWPGYAPARSRLPSRGRSNGSFRLEVRRSGGQRRLFAQPHLPQGAPTSPAVLANLSAYRLDARLSGLAQAAPTLATPMTWSSRVMSDSPGQ